MRWVSKPWHCQLELAVPTIQFHEESLPQYAHSEHSKKHSPLATNRGTWRTLWSYARNLADLQRNTAKASVRHPATASQAKEQPYTLSQFPTDQVRTPIDSTSLFHRMLWLCSHAVGTAPSTLTLMRWGLWSSKPWQVSTNHENE